MLRLRVFQLSMLAFASATVAAACGGAGGSAAQGGSTANGSSERSSGSPTATSGAGMGGAPRTGSSSGDGSGSGGATTGSGGQGTGASDAGPADAAADGCAMSAPDAGSCYANACAGVVHTLQDNRDRLVADLAKRKCTTACGLWAALSKAERYIFLMDTVYLAAPASRLYPPGANNVETALDHAVALYSINAPNGTNSGGNDYNRIYLGFDALGECVMRDFPIANATHDPSYNEWVTSDDFAGPHAPFTQREMIFWYKNWWEIISNGPQFHHWAKDADFTQSGIDQRLGVCGVTDLSLTELTIAFDVIHDSNPLDDYSSDGGYGWQIVDQHVGIDAAWDYVPTSCPTTAPVNTDTYGGGTFAGMGPTQVNGVCVATPLGDAGC